MVQALQKGVLSEDKGWSITEMILLKTIGVLCIIVFSLILCIIAGVLLAHTVVGILIGLNDGNKGLNQYDNIIEKEKSEFRSYLK